MPSVMSSDFSGGEETADMQQSDQETPSGTATPAELSSDVARLDICSEGSTASPAINTPLLQTGSFPVPPRELPQPPGFLRGSASPASTDSHQSIRSQVPRLAIPSSTTAAGTDSSSPSFKNDRLNQVSPAPNSADSATWPSGQIYPLPSPLVTSSAAAQAAAQTMNTSPLIVPKRRCQPTTPLDAAARISSEFIPHRTDPVPQPREHTPLTSRESIIAVLRHNTIASPPRGPNAEDPPAGASVARARTVSTPVRFKSPLLNMSGEASGTSESGISRERLLMSSEPQRPQARRGFSSSGGENSAGRLDEVRETENPAGNTATGSTSKRETDRRFDNRNASKTGAGSICETIDTRLNPHKLKIVKKIGTGTFSTVFLAEELPPGPARKVAVKLIEIRAAGGATRERIEQSVKRELEILKQLYNPFVVRMLSFSLHEDDLKKVTTRDSDRVRFDFTKLTALSRTLIVMPYCGGGDLFDLIAQHRNQIRPELVRRIFAEVVYAVHYLHSHNIVHRDIKLENVLINFPFQELTARNPTTSHSALSTLTDFGLSRKIDPAAPMLTTRCGSEDYVPPELMMGQPYDGRQTDAWALGVLLYSIMEGRLPFDPPPEGKGGGAARGVGRTAHRIARVEWAWYAFSAKGKGRVWDPTVWGGAKEIVESLLRRRDKRWSSEDVVKHPWVHSCVLDEMAAEAEREAADLSP